MGKVADLISYPLKASQTHSGVFAPQSIQSCWCVFCTAIDVSLQCPFSPSRRLSTLPRFLHHTRTTFLLRIRSQITSDISTPLSSTSAHSGGSTLPRKCHHDESSKHSRRRLRAQRSCEEDHHPHSLPIPRHPLQSQHLNEHDLISTLIMPPTPPLPPNHPFPTLPNPSLPSQPKSRRTSPS